MSIVPITASKRCRPAGARPSSAHETTAVIAAAGSSGMPNSRFKAIAPPMNSARSVAMATSSPWAHSIQVSGRGRCVRHSVGRSWPVAMPSLADSAWTNMASRLAAAITHSSR